MFSFIKATTITLFATAVLAAADAPYPITPDTDAQLKNLGPGVNTPDSEYTPYITPNEKYLFFQSNRSPSAGPEGDFDLWYSINKNYAKPGEPEFETSANVGLPINSENLDGHPTLRRLVDGGYEMYFSSFSSATRPGPALTNIYYTVWKDGKWTVPVPVAEVNTDFHDRMPSISQDGRYLFFSSDRPGGKGGDDIWVSELNKETGKWGEPKNAGNINSAASEVTPAIHADGITLYFSSNQSGGVGGYDIYFTQSVARLEDDSETDIMAKGWAKPMNLGKPYNSQFDDEYPTVIANGERVYFTSNRSEGIGAFDIYRAKVPLFARPVIKLSLSGQVTAGGKRPLSAKIALVAGNLKAKTESNAAEQGKFALKMVNHKLYKLTVAAEGYRAHEEEFDSRSIHSDAEIVKNINLVRDVKLPKSLSLKILVTDSVGKAVKAKYRIVPRKKKFTAVLTKGVPLLTLEEFNNDEAKALGALENWVLEVSADKKGHEPLRARRDVAEIMDQYKKELPAVMQTKFVLTLKGGTPVKPQQVVAKPKPEPEETEEEADDEQVKGTPGTAVLKYYGRVYFAANVHDKAIGDFAGLITKVKAAWKKMPKRKLYVYGHGDSRGTVQYNRKLSKLRAEFVRKQLIAAGIPAHRIVIQGAGKAQRRVKNDDTAAKQQKNRRAEVYLSVPVSAADKPVAEKPAAAKGEGDNKPAEKPASAEKEEKQP
ncbi:MAG: OmpA family protein [Turneriella sp.]